MARDNNNIRVKYLSVGANRYTAVADWHDDGTLAFGADRNVCLWSPTDPVPRGISKILSGHTADVRAVKFLPAVENDKAAACLVTGGDDQQLRVWTLGADAGEAGAATTGCAHDHIVVHEHEHEQAHAHAGAINCISALAAPIRGTTRRIFASGAADATVKLWALDSRRVTLLQTIRTKSNYLPLAISLSELGEDGRSFLLAVAGTTNVIQVFVATLKEGKEGGGEAGASGDEHLEFKLQATLPGHENWIRSLDIIPEKDEPGSDLILASASQDKYIRLWRIHKGSAAPLASDATSMGGDALMMMPGNKTHKLQTAAGGKDTSTSTIYSVTFEALLLGHEDWIYSARWNRKRNRDGSGSTLQLLSASADNSLAIWEADAGSGIWITTARLGEVSREKGATTATGSIGGFWTGLWSPRGDTVVTLGRTGSWRRWDYQGSDEDEGEYSDGRWVQNLAVSGHTRAATGLAWARGGAFLLSIGADQTTRLHAEWRKGRGQGQGTWHEMARPQIHGYDLNCVDTLGDASFVSGADEKLMRVFTMPRAVAKMLRRLSGWEGGSSGNSDGDDDEARLDALPDAASMPVLGLSNKAVDAPMADDPENDAGLSFMKKEQQRQEQQDQDQGQEQQQAQDDPSALLDPGGVARRAALEADHPPFEESLSRHTLWPEADKLYGHGYELSCLAASRDGRLVASACRASSATHAVIRVFERIVATTTRGENGTNTNGTAGGGADDIWAEQRPPLSAHSLTAARLRFAPPDDDLLLSVGRDRQWAVFAREKKDKQKEEKTSSSSTTFRLLQSNPKAHTRMILDAAWAPPARESSCRVFATAGRDKQVKIWAGRSKEKNESDGGKAGMSVEEGLSFDLVATATPDDHPVTALDFLSRPTADGRLVLAVGTEAGKLLVLTLTITVTVTATSEEEKGEGAAGQKEGGGIVVSVESSRELPSDLCLPRAVLQLAWRPGRPRQTREDGEEEEEDKGFEDLAVAGEDGSVRIYSVHVE